MNIYAKSGSKVTVTEQSIKNGYNHDKEKAERLLKTGEQYTVDYTVVENWSSEVFLKEFPGIGFNTVTFVDLPDVEFNKLHELTDKLLQKINDILKIKNVHQDTMRDVVIDFLDENFIVKP